MVENVWGIGGLDIFSYLLGVKEDSNTFNKEVFGNKFKRKILLEAKLKGI